MTGNILESEGKRWSVKDAKPYFDSYCKQRGNKIPESFMNFYEKNNGININDDDFEFVVDLEKAFGQREELSFQGVYSAEDIFLNFSDREGVSFPEGTLPFACIEEGEICISIRNDSFGQIFFCELNPMPDQIPEEDFEKALKKFNPSCGELPGIVLKIADSFEEFLLKVKIAEW